VFDLKYGFLLRLFRVALRLNYWRPLGMS